MNGRWARAVRRGVIPCRRCADELKVVITLDPSGYLDALLRVHEATGYRARLLQRRQVDRAWIRRVAACELAAGRHHVQTLVDAVYADLSLPNPRQEKS